jgi:plastocyanin
VPRLLLLLLACCGLAARAAEARFLVTDAKGAPVADAVVSLTPLENLALPAVAHDEPREIAQQNKEFMPYVTAVRIGTVIRFPNRDKVEHHVYSLSAAKKFEFPLYKPGKAEEITFDQPGVVIIGCSIHDWMAAYVVVLATPWFAVTPAAGTATLHDLPPGRYRAEIWQPRLTEPVTREVVVTESAAEPLAFQLKLKADLRRRAPLPSRGSGY